MDKLNLIQKQADDFITRTERPTQFTYKEYIQDIRYEIGDYNKTSYKIEFLERIKSRFKKDYDDHLTKCTYKAGPDKCPENQIYEQILFLVQEELEPLIADIGEEYFTIDEKSNANVILDEILQRLNKLELGQEIIYDDLKEEFDELKTFYFLKKKNWIELFTGKIAGMILGGVISETVSREIVAAIKEAYPRLIE